MIIDYGLVHCIYGSLKEILQSELGQAIKEACRQILYIRGKYKIIFYSSPPKFDAPVRPAIHDIYITKGQYSFPKFQVTYWLEEYDELIAKKTNHNNWATFCEAKELEGAIRFNPSYYMIFHNKITRIFIYGFDGHITKRIGRLIKPDFGQDKSLRKEYREYLSWYEVWQPDEIDDIFNEDDE